MPKHKVAYREKVIMTWDCGKPHCYHTTENGALRCARKNPRWKKQETYKVRIAQAMAMIDIANGMSLTKAKIKNGTNKGFNSPEFKTIVKLLRGQKMRILADKFYVSTDDLRTHKDDLVTDLQNLVVLFEEKIREMETQEM